MEGRVDASAGRAMAVLVVVVRARAARGDAVRRTCLNIVIVLIACMCIGVIR